MDREPRPRAEPNDEPRLIARATRALAELESVACARSCKPSGRSRPRRGSRRWRCRCRSSSSRTDPGAQAAGQLLRYLHAQIRESLLAAAAFKRGRVYCLRCESTACTHSSPPGARMVFAAYGETGRPQWVEIAELLAARHDPRLDRVYLGSRELVAMAISQDEIYERLLPVFPRPRASLFLLAQICIGRFLPVGSPPQGELMSLTVQAVQITLANLQTVVGLNLVALRADDAELAAAARRVDPGPTARRCARCAASCLRWSRCAAPWKRARSARLAGRSLPGTVPRCLAATLEHRTRVSGKRTRHARERSRQADRPTAKAFEDARAARSEDVFEDVREHTIVVLGARGRVHFFAQDGRHVTSVVFPAPAIRGRIAQRRWRLLAPADLAEFRRRTEP
ncbi:MAG: hypothetical protein U1E76_21485 [Planctomycetota bacterium]